MALGKRTETDAATLNFGEEFKNAHSLLNAEVLLLLEAHDKHRQADPAVPYTGPNPVLSKTKQHVESCCHSFKNRELIRDLRQSAIGTHGLSEFEMAQIGNLVPDGVDEARNLIPSLLGRVSDESLQRLLDDVSIMRRLG